MPFSKLGLSPKVLEGVEAAGYTDPTPIQLRAVPLVLSGSDLIGCAGTGSAHSSLSKIAWRWRAVAMAVMKSSS